MVLPSSAGKSAQEPEPGQKQVDLSQEFDFLSFLAGLETGAIPARYADMHK